MNKKYYRFFGGLLTVQEKWLNKMASRGFRLVRAEKFLYEFAPCPPNAVEYRVEFVAKKSAEQALDYRAFLEECGYRIWFKNINLSFSLGKVRYRPWADKGGKLATHATTYDRELLIVEKETDGTAFELHTSYQDRIQTHRELQAPYLALLVLFGLLAVVAKSWLFAIFAALTLIPVAVYQAEIGRLKSDSRICE